MVATRHDASRWRHAASPATAASTAADNRLRIGATWTGLDLLQRRVAAAGHRAARRGYPASPSATASPATATATAERRLSDRATRAGLDVPQRRVAAARRDTSRW